MTIKLDFKQPSISSTQTCLCYSTQYHVKKVQIDPNLATTNKVDKLQTFCKHLQLPNFIFSARELGHATDDDCSWSQS